MSKHTGHAPPKHRRCRTAREVCKARAHSRRTLGGSSRRSTHINSSPAVLPRTASSCCLPLSVLQNGSACSFACPGLAASPLSSPVAGGDAPGTAGGVAGRASSSAGTLAAEPRLATTGPVSVHPPPSSCPTAAAASSSPFAGPTGPTLVIAFFFFLFFDVDSALPNFYRQAWYEWPPKPRKANIPDGLSG